MKKDILEFINRRFDIDCRWTTGNCYWFAVILTSRFPQMEIWISEVITQEIVPQLTHPLTPKIK